MKSQHQDQKFPTSCKDCVFAIYENNTQVSCGFDRINKFKDSVIEAYDDDKEFYVIKKFCNLYRNNKWNNGVPDKEKAKIESSINYDVFIDCSDINEENKNTIIESINSNKYLLPTNKQRITLYHEASLAKHQRSMVMSVFHYTGGRCLISSCSSKYEFLHNSIVDGSQSYYVNLRTDQSFNNGIFDLINTKILDELCRYLIVKSGDVYFISTTLYKIESNETASQDFVKNNESIIDKIKGTDLYIEL